MTGAAPFADQTVVIRDGRIAEIGSAAEVRAPTDAILVDGTGKFLIPGLFEMHAHTSKTRASPLALYVVNRVTTLRDQGSEHAEVLRWRREVRSGARVGPRMLIADLSRVGGRRTCTWEAASGLYQLNVKQRGCGAWGRCTAT